MLISGQVSYLDTDLGFGVTEKDLEGKDKKVNVQDGVLDLQKNRRVWLENGVQDPFYKLGQHGGETEVLGFRAVSTEVCPPRVSCNSLIALPGPRQTQADSTGEVTSTFA